MGIKENFSQAVRELTGSGSKDDTKRDKSIDGMKNAVAADDTSEFNVPPANDSPLSFEDIEKRAAAAADEYSRQQTAFSSGDYAAQGQPVQQPGMNSGYTSNAAPTEPVYNNAAPQNNSFVQQNPYGNQQNNGYAQQNPYGNQQNNGYAQQNPYGNQQNNGYAQQNPYGNHQNNGYAQQNPYGNQQNNGYAQQNPYGNQQNNGYAQQNPYGNQQNGSYDPQNGGYQNQSYSTAQYQSPIDDNELTVISKNTVIDGNIRSFANMSVDGNVKGNVETTKDIDINGKIVGNIACNNGKMRTSQIQGNVQLKGNVFMERDTLLIGDLTSTYANVNGKIKGNLNTSGKTELKSDAVVFGDISASTITVSDGAIIQGYVSTTFLNKEESKNIFPDAITIGE